MTKIKSTKRALLLSALSLLLCVSMLIGSTYAWFTDSVVSGSNVIKSGNLDLEVEYSLDGGTWEDLNGANDLFKKGLWEPGHTEVVALRIKNVGSLALKYVANMNILKEVVGTNKDGGAIVLSEILTVSTLVMDGGAIGDALASHFFTDENAMPDDSYQTHGTFKTSNILKEDDLLLAGETKYVLVKVDMAESVGNEANHKGPGYEPSIEFGINVFATQYTNEKDSFGSDYDKDAKYAANITVTAPVADVVNNETTQPLTITYQDDSSKVSDVEIVVPQGTKLEDNTTELVLKIVEKDNVEASVSTLITSEQTATTYEISLDGVADDNTAAINVSLVIEKGLVDVQLYHNNVLIPSDYDAITGELSFVTTGFSPFTVVSSTKIFENGAGTKDSPYVINTPEDLLNISKYYHEYKYYKVADGVKTLDMTGVGKIKLNGSFDGNGVTMNNLTTALFQSVGKSGVAQNIKISNLTANVNVTDGSALVKNIYNSGETTFENVTLHGYIEGQYNMGSFYNYGTANAGDSDGADYTVNFVNTKSDATLVCTTGNAIGGMLGHGYEGADYKLSINMDANSGYTGDMYTTGTATCYKVMAMCSHATYVLNGTEVSRYNDTYPSTRLVKIAPTAGTDGYYVTPATDVDHYVVYLNSQLTAYDANGNKIANKAGMTWNLGKKTIASGLEGKVFDLITSAKIVNDTANDLGYAMNNGELTIYSGRSDNYASGWVTLQVNQYDANGVLLATGIITVHTFAEP